jgi:hypothetical protein
MKEALLIVLIASWMSFAQEVKKELVGKEQPGAVLEHFTLKGGRTYDGIWDAAKSQIHIIQKSNHVANLPVSSEEILARKKIGDGSTIKIYSDADVAEKVLFLNLQNYKTAQARLAAANRNRDALHTTYKGKNLRKAEYDAVMARYKAADEEANAAEKAVAAAQAGFNKAREAYKKAGGKTEYSLP